MCTLSGAVSAVDSCRAETLWAEKIPSTTAVASLNTFGRNEIEVAPISLALLRIACLVILYKTCRVRTKNSQPMGDQDRYEDSMQLDRVTQNLFRLSIFSELMAHSGIPTHASEGSLGPRGRCVSPRAGPLIPAQPISHRGQSMSALSLAFPQ